MEKSGWEWSQKRQHVGAFLVCLCISRFNTHEGRLPLAVITPFIGVPFRFVFVVFKIFCPFIAPPPPAPDGLVSGHD